MTQTLKMMRVLKLLVLVTPLPQRISCIVSNHPGISIPVIQSSTRSTHTQGHYKRESQASQRLLRLWYWILDSTMCTLCSPNVPEMHVDDHPFFVKQSVFEPLMYLSQMLYFLKKTNSITFKMKLTEDTIVLWNSSIIWVDKNKRYSWRENNKK